MEEYNPYNDKNVEIGAVYPNSNHSYSFDAFQYLFLGCLDDNSYTDIFQDLKLLYLKCLPADRVIDPHMYKAALDNYVRRR
jgi:hypothetical protein